MADIWTSCKYKIVIKTKNMGKKIEVNMFTPKMIGNKDKFKSAS